MSRQEPYEYNEKLEAERYSHVFDKKQTGRIMVDHPGNTLNAAERIFIVEKRIELHKKLYKNV